MTKHIGIVGCSAEGASLCYRTICVDGAAYFGAHSHPEVSMHTPSLKDYTDCLEVGDLNGVGDLMLASAEKLAAIGADFLICPDNTIHQAFDYVQERSPLPWLHIADVVASAAQDRGCRKLLITGTKWLTESDVYPDKLTAQGLEFVRPDAGEMDEIQRIIMDELVNSIFKPEAVATFQKIFHRYSDEGCDAAILGCTEIPLIINDGNAGIPVLDSTRLLAHAALREAAG